MEAFHDLLSLLIACFGLYVVVYAMGMAKTHPVVAAGRLVGSSLRFVLRCVGGAMIGLGAGLFFSSRSPKRRLKE